MIGRNHDPDKEVRIKSMTIPAGLARAIEREYRRERKQSGGPLENELPDHGNSITPKLVQLFARDRAPAVRKAKSQMGED